MKALEAEPHLIAASLPAGSQDEVTLAWAQRLREHSAKSNLLTARELYMGRAFQLALIAVEQWRKSADCTLYVISAGLGLVHEDLRVPPYGLSISAKGQDDIRARVVDEYDIMEWWRWIANGPYSSSPGRMLENVDLVVAALSAPYMQMATPLIEAITTNERAVPLYILGLHHAPRGAAVMPYDRTLDRLLPGTGFDLSARALWHFATEIWPRHPRWGQADCAVHKDLVLRALCQTEPMPALERPAVPPAGRPVPKGLIF